VRIAGEGVGSEVYMEALLDQVELVDQTITDVAPATADVAPAGATRADRAMERYADGDDEAFAELYDGVAPRLFGFALRWTRSRSAAEDVVQQTLLQIHAARHRFVRGGAVLPWAYAIARRLLIDLGRRDGREVLRGDGVRDPEEPAVALAQDEALELRRMEAAAQRDLAALPPGWRDAFELVKFEGLSVAETAEVLGITRAMVKIRTHRATVALRAAVERRLHRDSSQGGSPS
jgi:RNA polymerase sigma-70 factor (ECF subfamily)